MAGQQSIGRGISRREALKRGGGLVLGATALGSFLSACGSGGGSASGAVEPGSLEELAKAMGRPVTYQLDAGIGPLYQPYMKVFNQQYAPLESKLALVPTDFTATTQTQLAGGSTSFDILIQDPGYLRKWHEAGWVREVGDLPGVEEQIKAMDQKLLPAVRDDDGRLIGLPYQRNTELFIYNAEHLGKIGAKPPETWDEFLEQCRELKAKGVSATPYSPFWNRDFNVIWNAFAAEIIGDGCGPLFGDDLKATFATDPAAARTLTRWQTALKEGLAPADGFTTSYGNTVNVFAGGKSSFTIRYGPQLKGFADPKQSRVAKAAKNALMPGPKHATLTWGTVAMVTAKTPSPAAAAEMLTFITGKDRKGVYRVPGELVVGLGAQTAYPEINRDPATQKEWGTWADAKLLSDQVERGTDLGAAANASWYGTFLERITPILQDTVRGKHSVPDGLKQASALVDELRS